MMQWFALAEVVLLALPVSSAAQSVEDWGNLKQLRVGQKVEVVDMKLKSLQGEFSGYAEDAISLRVDGGEISIPRRQVFSLKSRERSHRRRNTLLGLAIGAGGGLAAGAIRGATYHEAGETGVFVLVCSPIGAGIGAIAGAAIPTGQVTIYRAHSKAQ